MKWFARTLPLGMLLVLFLFLPQRGGATSSDEQVNQCFSCHTNARKLIQITREIAKARQGEPKAEVKSEGEG